MKLLITVFSSAVWFGAVTENELVCVVSESGVSPSPVQYGQVSGRHGIGQPTHWSQLFPKLHSKLATRLGQQNRTVSSTKPVPSPRPGQIPGPSLSERLDQLNRRLQARRQSMLNATSPAEERKEQTVQRSTSQPSTSLIQEHLGKEVANKSKPRRRKSEIMSRNKTAARANEIGEIWGRGMAAVEKQQTGQPVPQGPSRQAAEQAAGKETEGEGKKKTKGVAEDTDEDNLAGQKNSTETIPSDRGDQPVGKAKDAAHDDHHDYDDDAADYNRDEQLASKAKGVTRGDADAARDDYDDDDNGNNDDGRSPSKTKVSVF